MQRVKLHTPKSAPSVSKKQFAVHLEVIGVLAMIGAIVSFALSVVG